MKKYQKNMFIIFVIVILFELVLRIFGWGDPPIAVLDSDIEYYPKPSSEFNRYGNIVKTNSYGMRSNEFSHQNPGPLHISLFGDSVVYGNHQLDQAETISYRLEKMLQRNTNKEAIVSSIAASSWGPQNIEAFFDKKGPFYGKLAVIIQSSHDRQDVKNDTPSIKPPYRLMKSYTAIGDFVERIWEWISSQYSINKLSSKYSLSEKREITKLSLIRLIHKLKASYSHVLLYYHVSKPQIMSLGYDSSLTYYQKIANEQGIDFLDSTVEYNKVDCKNSLYLDHLHFSKQGTKCVCEILFNRITQYI